MAYSEQSGAVAEGHIESWWPIYLRKRWVYALLLGGMCAIVLAAAIGSYREIDRELTGVALSRRAAVAQLAAATLSEKFHRLVDVALSLATRVRFRELVAAGKFLEASAILRDVPHDFPFVERLFLTDPHGVLMADVPELPGVRGKNFAYRDWYKGVSREWRPYLSPVYERAAEPRVNVFVVGVPIQGPNGSVAGILVMQMRPEPFFEWLRGIVFEPDEYVYVVDPRGRLVFHSGLPRHTGLRDFSGLRAVREVRAGKLGIEIGRSPIRGEESVSAYAPVAGYGWGVIAQQSTEAAFAAKRQHVQQLLLAYGLTLLMFVLGVYLMVKMVLHRREAETGRRMKLRLERLVAKRTAELEATNRELESFSYSVSHDLRSPLRAIDGFSRILEEDYAEKLDGEGRRLLGVVRDGSKRMGQLIDDLLAFARLGRKSLVMGDVDMSALVRSVLEELRSEPGASIPECVIGDLPHAEGDAALLRQVWANLLTNAIKFTRTRDKPRIEISGWTDEREIVYCVKDNGVGFDMQYYEKLFGVFQRLHSAERFPGTGIGLAIVQRVIARHDGRVWAEGRVDAGASFCFALPQRGTASVSDGDPT